MELLPQVLGIFALFTVCLATERLKPKFSIYKSELLFPDYMQKGDTVKYRLRHMRAGIAKVHGFIRPTADAEKLTENFRISGRKKNSESNEDPAHHFYIDVAPNGRAKFTSQHGYKYEKVLKTLPVDYFEIEISLNENFTVVINKEQFMSTRPDAQYPNSPFNAHYFYSFNILEHSGLRAAVQHLRYGDTLEFFGTRRPTIETDIIFDFAKDTKTETTIVAHAQGNKKNVKFIVYGNKLGSNPWQKEFPPVFLGAGGGPDYILDIVLKKDNHELILNGGLIGKFPATFSPEEMTEFGLSHRGRLMSLSGVRSAITRMDVIYQK